MKTNFEHLKKQFSTENIQTIKYQNTEMLSVTVEDIIKSEETAAVLPHRKNIVRTSIGYITI
jgi:hypothetical protein